MLILAIGILLVSGIERSTARSFVDRQRAELAAAAGLEEVRGILGADAANDGFIILQSTLEQPIIAGREPAPHAFLARGEVGGSGISFKYSPLFSTANKPSDTTTLEAPQPESLVDPAADDSVEFSTLPYLDKVRAAWMPVQDEKGRTVARYAYWVEDLQGKLDPELVGNTDGPDQTHVRAAYPIPAPGLNPEPDSDTELPLDQIALFAIDPASTEDDQGGLATTLKKNRELLISPNSLLAAAGVSAPIVRDESGHNVDDVARAVEESLSAGLQTYREQALVPFVEGIDPSVAGEPKLNLNKLLSTGGDAAVGEMADFIEKGLPSFETRKGGFPDDYARTIAANAIDYADEDGDSTVAPGSHRGLDGFPLVSEFLMRFRWENIVTEGGRKKMVLSASTYVELWNMSDQVISGSTEVSFETAYNFPLGANPSVSLADLTDATPVLAEEDGYRWFPAQQITLNPGEYRVLAAGTVTYRIDAGSAAFFIPSPLVLEGETFGSSGAGYRLKWNGSIVDQSRGGLHRNNSSLNYPTDTSGKPRQRTRTTIPSHSHTRQGNFKNNMGDPRMSFYNLAPQDANVYPDNYSPNRRNIRWGTIYKRDGSTKTKIYGRVLPSEWPDGGHNSIFESISFYTEDERINPDDPRFFPSNGSVLRNPPPEEAPLRLSNRGRFFSATELGRVYDPLMWEISFPAGAGLPWGDVMTSSHSSTDFGGGNTLRIGRPEHPRFDLASEPGKEAYHLLDLFHAGLSRSENAAEREGGEVLVKGHVNINTASRDALRAMVMGAVTTDPLMARRISESHEVGSRMAPLAVPVKLTSDQIKSEADRIADAIVEARKVRPFASPSTLSELRDASGAHLFGNKDLLPNGSKLNIADSASEELFARVYEASTVRSRNFRVWVVGQAVAPTTSSSAKPEVLAEFRRVYSVFADPGERESDGSINPLKTKLTILNENDF